MLQLIRPAIVILACHSDHGSGLSLAITGIAQVISPQANSSLISGRGRSSAPN
jgi:predicted phage tail protein